MKAPTQRARWHDAYDAQMGLWRWYRTEQGRSFMASHFSDNAAGVMPDTQPMLRDMYAMEMTRLLDSDPIWISPDMCQLVDVARETFKPEPLLETDLMTTHGFMFWDRPIEVPDRFDFPMQMQAMSWQLIYNSGSKEEKASWEKTYGVDYSDAPEEFRQPDGRLPFVYGMAVTIYCESESYLASAGQEMVPGLPPVLPMHLTPWYFGMTFDGNEVDEFGKPTGAAWWWKVAQVTLRLMQQKLSVKSYHRPDRSTRREAKAAGLPHESEIVVVRLRREEGPRKEPSGEEGNYSHRWIVHGGWQWRACGPGHSLRRQVYINDYVKGPEDKPLIVRPRRVFQWDK